MLQTRTHLTPVSSAVTLRNPRAAMVPVTLEQLPRTVNLLVYRGDDVGLNLTVSELDESPAILAGATFRAQIRRTPDALDVEGELTVAATDNVVELHLPASVSAALPAQGAWDCEMVRGGWVTTLAAGRLIVTPDVTR
jgi:hypothetical protein